MQQPVFYLAKYMVFPFQVPSGEGGDSPIRTNMWSDVIGNLKKRLSSWKSIHLAKGGRVLMITSVFNYIFLYILSFYNNKRYFLSEVRKKVHWMS